MFLVLSAKTESLDERTVTLDINVLEVTEQATALAYKQEQTATRVVVVLVLFEMFGQVFDALSLQRNLHLRGPGVTWMGCILFDDRLLDSCV